ncbi:MAG: hypothetical protein ABFR62_13380 [Bacteroidota bacterium]
MKFLKLTQLVVLISLFAAFTSCDKDEEVNEPKSIEELLAGKWIGNEFYEDGVLSQFNDIFKMSFIEFKTDGSGIYESPFGLQPLIWSYDNTTEKLRIESEVVDDGSGFTIDADIIEGAEIIKIDNSTLWYTYESDGVVIEERYNKF